MIPAVIERCAGIDVGRKFVVVCVMCGDAHATPTLEVRKFSMLTEGLEQLRVWREMDDRGEEPVVIYHSHTATEAYPSRTDISYASEPGAHYVLVSTREPDRVEFRSFRIVDGEVTEEEVRITGGDGAAAAGTGDGAAVAE